MDTSTALKAILAFTDDNVQRRPAHTWLALHGTMERVYWESRKWGRDGALDKALDAGKEWLIRNIG